jgi:hypothetical protein
MVFPITLLEGRKVPRVIFSIKPVAGPSDQQQILSLMKKAYSMEVWCFDLPSRKHLNPFRELKRFTGDEALIGLCHVDAEEGTSFLGRPLHLFEPKVVSTIKKNLFLPDSLQISSPLLSHEVLTQKEIDRITFDPVRYGKMLSLFDPRESPFLMLGERYGDWLLALGRLDLLGKMVSKAREAGFIPVFSGQWATFALPKAKALDVSAYAVPINKRRSLFDLNQACELIKKFDKPVISLNPLGDANLRKRPGEAFSFLFEELKIYSAIAEISTENDLKKIVQALENVPSLITPRKT